MNVDNPRFGLRNLNTAQYIAIGVGIAATALVLLLWGLGQFNSDPGPNASTGGLNSCAPGPNEGTEATIEISGDLTLSCTLDGPSGDVSPTDSIIAAVWTEVQDNLVHEYSDLISISIGGPVGEGTVATSVEGVSIGFDWNREGSSGVIFQHHFESRDGQCNVTMHPTSGGLTGSFDCPAISDEDGHNVKVAGTFEL